jgi:hypothetical protein
MKTDVGSLGFATNRKERVMLNLNLYRIGLFKLVIIFGLLITFGCSGGGGGGGDDDTEVSADQFPFEELQAPINSGSFLYSFLNDDGYYYNFYGERDDRNVPQLINKLVLAKDMDSDRSALFLQIEFDEHQRPIKVILPDAQGMIEIEYINDVTAEVTTTGPDGTQETVTVDHPFQLPTQAPLEASRGVISDAVCDQITHSWLDKSIQIHGDIEGCEGGPQPNVEIVGGTPPKSYFADLSPINVFGEDTSSWLYSVSIDTEIPVEFDTWVKYCECNIAANIVLTATGGNEVLDVAIAAGEGLGNFIKDIQNESVVNTTKNTLGAVIDALTTGGTAETLGQLVDFGASGGTLPCTRERYDLSINTIENEYKAYCDFGSDNTKLEVFDPLTGEGPDFDWSGQCSDNGVERQWYVFKLSGVGYHKTFGVEAAKVTGYEYQALWLLPSEVDGIVGTNFDNTTACENGPWAGPVLAPAIWESGSMVKTAGPLDSFDDLEPYRCPVPNWVYNNPICDQWAFEYSEDFYNDINSLCGN